MFCGTANYLIPKSFNPNIASAFSVDIAIAEADLVKYFVGNSRIVKTSSVVEKIMCIGHHRRFSSSITSYEVRAVAYCFYSREILTKNTDLSTIAVADEEPYNLTTIGVHTAIDFNAKAC